MTMADFSPFRLRNPNMTLKERFLHLSWCYIFLIFLVAFSMPRRTGIGNRGPAVSFPVSGWVVR